MKERQRWQPEEDALLLSYVKQYGPKEWNLISHRMGGAAALNRDPKSCLERYKNYLKPGVKKGSLTPEEQSLVVSLQAKYGNKWKKIAAELPGRTPKRLGKWWEVFKEKQQKQIHAQNRPQHGRVFAANSASPEDLAGRGRYDHILDTFAEKYVQPSLLPPWANPGATSSFSSPSCSGTGPASPSVSLTLSPAEPDPVQPDLALIVQCCKELEESREKLEQHKKEATWRLSRLEQQLLAEKARRRKEKMEEIEARVRALREEEMAYLCGMEMEYRERVRALQRDDENREGKLVESWCGTHAKLAKLLEPLGLQSRHTGFNLL